MPLKFLKLFRGGEWGRGENKGQFTYHFHDFHLLLEGESCGLYSTYWLVVCNLVLSIQCRSDGVFHLLKF